MSMAITLSFSSFIILCLVQVQVHATPFPNGKTISPEEADPEFIVPTFSSVRQSQSQGGASAGFGTFLNGFLAGFTAALQGGIAGASDLFNGFGNAANNTFNGLLTGYNSTAQGLVQGASSALVGNNRSNSR